MRINIHKGIPIHSYLKIFFKHMRIQLLLLVLAQSVCLAGSLKGQTINDTRITLQAQHIAIKNVFRQIESQTKFTIGYNADEINENEKVSVDATNKTVMEVLRLALKSYRGDIVQVNDTQIFLKLKKAPKVPVTVSGTVKDESGQTLIGVTVTEKNVKNAVTTNADGQYKIRMADGNDTLVFSYISYAKQQVPVMNRTNIDVVMKAEKGQLGEVVVVGYGTQKKASITGSVSQIVGNDLVRRPVTNIQQAFQGQAVGVTVQDLGGIPGRSQANVRVRGVTTFNVNSSSDGGGYDLSKNDALVIVDGVEQRLMDINPNDIESVSLLKDASSTAIYGSRATNGVLLITTKRAKSGKAQVDFNTYYAIQNSTNKPVMMDIESYMREQVIAYNNAGTALPARFTEESIQAYIDPNADRYKYPLPNTWFQTMLHPAPQFSENLSVSGGSDMFQARASARYQEQKGVVNNYDDKIKEIRVATDYMPAKTLKFSADLNWRNNVNYSPTTDPMYYFTSGTLWAVPKYPDGTYGLSSKADNPLMYDEISGRNNIQEDYIFGSIKADWTIIKGLTFSTQYATRLNLTYQKVFANAYNNTDKNTGINRTVSNNSLNETRNDMRENTLNSLLTYDRQFGHHSFKALVGYSEIDNVQHTLNAYRERFYNNDIESINQGTNDGTKSNTGADSEYGLRSYFGRINYNFADKYLLEANGRYDGSSKFTGDKQYSFFPSFSGGWRVSQENFWKNLKPAVSDLKLRGSWGITGNQSVGLYSYYPSLTVSTYTFGGAAASGYKQTTLANTDLGWESTKQLDIGADVVFLNDHFNLTFDYYNKQTNDILLNLAIPATIGLTAPAQNAGSVKNSGYEFTLGYHDTKPKEGFHYNLVANFSINKNVVTDLKGTGPYIYGNDTSPRYIIQTGLPINTFWGYKTAGVFQTQAEIDSYPTYATNTKPGDVKYIDLNGDGKIDANDMTAIGNSFPKYNFGFNADLSYKGFSLNVLFQGAADVNTRLSGPLTQMGNNEGFVPDIYTNNYWTPEHTDARFPRPIKGDFRNVATADDQILNASYLRLKNVQLGYTLPQSITKKLAMKRAFIYVSGTNLLTFSALNEWHLDPEIPPGKSDYYPQISLYTIGLNVQF